MTSVTTTDSSITIRLATEDDTLALRRLAQLDGASLPEGVLLLAEVEGEIRAALRVADSAYVADPFYPSAELVGMLDTRAKRIRQQEISRGERIRMRFSLWSTLYQRAADTRPML